VKKIGYIPLSSTKYHPGDDRRFPGFLQRNNIEAEIANPNRYYDVIFLTQSIDLAIWGKYKERYPSSCVIFDYVDAYDLEDSSSKNYFRGIVRWLKNKDSSLIIDNSRAVKNLVLSSDLITTASMRQAELLSFYETPTLSIPDNHYFIKRPQLSSTRVGNKKNINLLWEGLGTNLYQLNYLSLVISRLSSEYNISLHVLTDLHYYKYLNSIYKVSASKVLGQFGFAKIFYYQWSYKNLIEIARLRPICLIPIDSSSRVAYNKPPNKLYLLWKLGLPVITSNTPSYKQEFDNIGLDYTCNSLAEWESKIILLNDSELETSRYIRISSSYIWDKFSTEKIDSIWRSLIS